MAGAGWIDNEEVESGEERGKELPSPPYPLDVSGKRGCASAIVWLGDPSILGAVVLSSVMSLYVCA